MWKKQNTVQQSILAYVLYSIGILIFCIGGTAGLLDYIKIEKEEMISNLLSGKKNGHFLATISIEDLPVELSFEIMFDKKSKVVSYRLENTDSWQSIPLAQEKSNLEIDGSITEAMTEDQKNQYILEDKSDFNQTIINKIQRSWPEVSFQRICLFKNIEDLIHWEKMNIEIKISYQNIPVYVKIRNY